MMKKSILAAFALAAVAAPVCAQTEQAGTMEETIEYSDDKYKVETNHFWDNWFVTVGPEEVSLLATMTDRLVWVNVFLLHWILR